MQGAMNVGRWLHIPVFWGSVNEWNKHEQKLTLICQFATVKEKKWGLNGLHLMITDSDMNNSNKRKDMEDLLFW